LGLAFQKSSRFVSPLLLRWLDRLPGSTSLCNSELSLDTRLMCLFRSHRSPYPQLAARPATPQGRIRPKYLLATKFAMALKCRSAIVCLPASSRTE
jgi:hypothetical protein